MPIVHQTQHATVHAGDCLDVLRELPDESVHAVITDPPYGLSNTTPAQVAECLREWATGNTTYTPAKRGGFMGNDWDSFVPPPAVWAECLRVLKPGGHLLAFAGSRTQDLMGMSVRLAGFDIRDNFAWLYGTGFPKSANVSKAIDKVRTEDKGPVRVVCRAIRAAMDADRLLSRHLVEHFDNCNPRLIDHWAARDTDSQPALPTPAQWETLRRVLPALDGELDAEVARLNARKGTPGAAWESREVTGTVDEWTDRTNFALTSRDGLRRDQAHKGTAAQQWEGWGTALKPAFEPVIMARKPFKGNVAANVLEHGTGALNIDASRIGGNPRTTHAGGNRIGNRDNASGYVVGTEGATYQGSSAGRFPANVILDESQAAALDQQSGTLKSGVLSPANNVKASSNNSMSGGNSADRVKGTFGGDSGGASRFFYCAKAPKSERPNVNGTAHPTVKPRSLMRYLIRMVTPPGGTILDPFAGSGTTLEAATQEGFESIGVEAHPDYLPLIAQRLDRGEDQEQEQLDFEATP